MSNIVNRIMAEIDRLDVSALSAEDVKDTCIQIVKNMDKRKIDMKHTIIFNKDSSSQYYYYKEFDDSAWYYNSDFVRNMMTTNDLILKDRGWLYLREVYERLGIESLPISPILGWDAYQNPKFKYKIIEHKDENSFEIILNPEELK